MPWLSWSCAGLAVLAGLVAGLRPEAGALVAAAAVLLALLALLVRQLRRRFPRAVRPPLRLEVVALPLALGISSQSAQLSQLAVMALAGLAVYRYRGLPRPSLPLVLLMSAWLLIWLHAIQPPVFITAAGVAAIAATCKDPKATISSLIDGIGIYLSASVAAYYGLGLRSPAESQRIGGLISSSAIFDERVIFPFASSLAVPGILATVYLVGMVALIPVKQGKRELLMSGMALAVLLAVDNRAGILASAVVAVLALLSPKRGVAVASVLAAAALVAPFWLGPGAGANWTQLSALQRTDDARGSLLNNRDRIWDEALRYHASRSSPLEAALGYGPQGSYKSGASQIYGRFLVGGVASPATASTHNSATQVLFDGGWVGLAVYLSGLLLLYRRLRPFSPFSLAGRVMLIAFALTAATEVALSPGSVSDPWWLLLLLAGAASRPERAQADTARDAVLRIDDLLDPLEPSPPDDRSLAHVCIPARAFRCAE